MKRSKSAAALLVLLGAASYGVMSPIVKTAIADGWDVRALTFAQVSGGALMLWALLLARSKFRLSMKMRPGVWLLLAAIGIAGLSLTTLFYNQSLARLDASLAIVLLFQYTWITILLESIRARRWPAGSEWLAVLLIFAGTILAVGILERSIGHWDGTGLLLGLLSAVSYSLFFFLSGFLPPSLEPLAKSAVMATASLAFIGLAQGIGTWTTEGTAAVPLVAWGLLLGLLGIALPTVCFNAGIPRIGAGLAALLGSLELPVAVLAAYVLLGEPLSWWQGAGVVLIVAGILAAQHRRSDSTAARRGSEE